MSRHRKIFAGLLFILAALLVVYVGTLFYLERVNPTDTKLINQRLSSPENVEAEELARARSEGYSDAEIVKFLAERNAKRNEQKLKKLFLVELTTFAALTLVGLGVAILPPRP